MTVLGKSVLYYFKYFLRDESGGPYRVHAHTVDVGAAGAQHPGDLEVEVADGEAACDYLDAHRVETEPSRRS